MNIDNSIIKLALELASNHDIETNNQRLLTEFKTSQIGINEIENLSDNEIINLLSEPLEQSSINKLTKSYELIAETFGHEQRGILKKISKAANKHLKLIEKLNETLEDCYYLFETYSSNLSKLSENLVSINSLTAKDEALGYLLTKNKNLVSDILIKLPKNHPYYNIVKEYESIIQKVQQAPFFKRYETYDFLKNALKESLNISDEFYLKNILKALPRLVTASEKVTPNKIQSIVTTSFDKLLIYVLHSERKSVEKWLTFYKNNEIYDEEISQSDWQNFSTLYEYLKTVELAPNKELAPPSILLNPSKILTSSEHVCSNAEKLWLKSLDTFHTKKQIAEDLLHTQVQDTQNKLPEDQFSSILEKIRSKTISPHTFIDQIGSKYLNNGKINFSLCKFLEQQVFYFSFELNSPFLENFYKVLDNLADNSEHFQKIFSAFISDDSKIKIEHSDHVYPLKEDNIFSLEDGSRIPNSKNIVVTIGDKIKIILPTRDAFYSLKSLFQVVLLDPEDTKVLSTLSLITSSLFLPPIFEPVSSEQIQITNLINLHEAYSPKTAHQFAANPENYFFDYKKSLNKIISLFPNFEEIFSQNQITSESTQISPEMQKNGAKALLVGLGGAFEITQKSLPSILRYGLLSSKKRLSLGISKLGQSSIIDHREGGADSVFTRLITDYLSQRPLSNFPFSGSIQLIIDLSAVNKPGTYGYVNDHWGTKEPQLFYNRKNLIELTKVLNTSPEESLHDPRKIKSHGISNEICIPNEISPELIKKIVIQDEIKKNSLIDFLQSEGYDMELLNDLITVSNSTNEVLT